MHNPIQRVYPETNDNMYATFFPIPSGKSSYKVGIVHEATQLNRGPVLGGTRFGGIFEIAQSPLSTSETRILALRSVGVLTGRLCAELSLSEATIRTHQKRLIHKLGVSSMAEAVATAFCGEEPFFIPSVRGETIENITPRQKRVIQGIAQGLNTVEVARTLQLSQSTVRCHIKNAYVEMRIPGDNFISLVTLAHLTDAVFSHNNTELEAAPLEESRDCIA